MYNAFQSLQAFDMGQGARKERERETAMKGLGNAFAQGDYTGAAGQAFNMGDVETGLRIKEYDQGQQAEAGKKTAGNVLRLFSNMEFDQINNYAMSDPVGFERETGIASDEYLGQAKQLQSYGLTPDQYRQMVIQKAQAELGMAPAGPTEGKVVNNRLVNPITGELMGDFSDAPETEYVYEQIGDEIVAIDKRDPNNRIPVGKAPVKAPLVSVNTGDKQESAFATEAGKIEAQSFGTLVEMGHTARRNRVVLDQLDVAAASTPDGMTAVVKSTLGNMGIQTEGLSDIQATEALINQLVPAQRAPGSGPMSDKDLALFKSSLPRLIQTAEGRAKILTNMKAVNDYVMAEGRIANQVLSGEITPQEGRAQMEALGNPLSEYAGGGSDLPPGFVVIE